MIPLERREKENKKQERKGQKVNTGRLQRGNQKRRDRGKDSYRKEMS